MKYLAAAVILVIFALPAQAMVHFGFVESESGGGHHWFVDKENMLSYECPIQRGEIIKPGDTWVCIAHPVYPEENYSAACNVVGPPNHLADCLRVTKL